MMMIVLAGFLGFALGCLLTVCFFLIVQQREEAAAQEQWREKQARMQEKYAAQLKEQLRKQRALLLREQERRLQELRASMQDAIPVVEKPTAASPQPSVPPKKPKPQFEAVQSLKLEFRSATPDPQVNPFFPGEGYLRDRENRLIPRQECFQTLNTGRGYAEQGMLWAFDAIYRGECYSFAQIRTGALADRFFRLAAVVEPAVVESRTGYNIYYLKTKGKLEITDP